MPLDWWLTINRMISHRICTWFSCFLFFLCLYQFCCWIHVVDSPIFLRVASLAIVWLPQCQWRNPEGCGVKWTVVIPNKVPKQSLTVDEKTSDWRNANIAPVFKNGNRDISENYRPAPLCKIMEHVTCSHRLDVIWTNMVFILFSTRFQKILFLRDMTVTI